MSWLKKSSGLSQAIWLSCWLLYIYAFKATLRRTSSFVFVTALVIKLLLWYLCFFLSLCCSMLMSFLRKKNTFLVYFFLFHVKTFYFFQLRLCGAEKVASELKCYCDFFLFLFSIWLQIFSHMPEDSTAPPVPPPRINPRKRQPITISKRPARVYQALSHELYQHTESNYQPLLAWLSPSSSSLSHAVFAEHTVDFFKNVVFKYIN